MNIDKLKEVIQEANPEIVKNKIFCKECDGDGIVIAQIDENNAKQEQCENCGAKGYIISHPIRLADVLLAIGNKSVGVDATGEIVRVKRYDDRRELVAQWKLKDNNLDNQSNGCKAFLTKLLVK